MYSFRLKVISTCYFNILLINCLRHTRDFAGHNRILVGQRNRRIPHRRCATLVRNRKCNSQRAEASKRQQQSQRKSLRVL